MDKAVFPGTFDPPTLGHLEAIERATRLTGILYVAVGDNSKKSRKTASLEKRVDWLKQITSHLKNVHVVTYEGLLVDFAEKNAIKVAIRSIRGATELEHETMQAKMNQAMTGLETLFLPSNLSHISSSLVREVAAQAGRIELFVPKAIAKDVLEIYRAT